MLAAHLLLILFASAFAFLLTLFFWSIKVIAGKRPPSSSDACFVFVFFRAPQKEFKAVITLLQLRFDKIDPVTFVEKWFPGKLPRKQKNI